jgi:hypothetical protein
MEIVLFKIQNIWQSTIQLFALTSRGLNTAKNPDSLASGNALDSCSAATPANLSEVCQWLSSVSLGKCWDSTSH